VNAALIAELAQEVLAGNSSRALSALVPARYGGLELSHGTYGEINRLVAESSPSSQSMLTVHGMVCRALTRWGSPAMRETYLPWLADGNLTAAFAVTEEGAGSDLRQIATSARQLPDGWLLNGCKKWITFGQAAGLFLVFATGQPHDLALLVHRDDPGVRLRPAPATSGFRDARLADLELCDCRIPANRLVGRPGAALTHIAADALTLGRLSVAFGAWGLARAALRAALRRSISREQFGGPIHSRQLVRGMLADASAAVDAAQELCRRAARAMDQRDEWAVHHVLTAKLVASRAATTATATAAQLHGASGLIAGCDVDLYVHDARVFEVIEGNTQLLQDLIATQALARFRSEDAAQGLEDADGLAVNTLLAAGNHVA
jgi:glutaryl-CoA dehydrogenase (non-decarboxylating)